MKDLGSRVTAALSALLLVLAPVSAIADVVDGNTPTNGKPSSGQVGAGWDGTTHRVFRSNPSGILRIGEEYPREFQKYNEILYSSTVVAVSTENTAPIVWTNAHLYGQKWLRVKLTNYATGAPGLNGGFVVRVKGSVDGVTYQHIVTSRVIADTVSVLDTLQFKFYNNSASPSANGTWVPLTNPTNGATLPFPFLQFALVNRGSATATLELEVMGRQF